MRVAVKRDANKPLGATSRKLLVLLALLEHHGKPAPSVTELRRALRLDEPRKVSIERLASLRRRGLVRYVDDVPRSLRVTRAGYVAATGKDGR